MYRYQIFMKIKIFYLFITCYLLVGYTIFGQNIYDFQHAKKYADYLSKSGQYDLAAKEYERLVFMNNEDDSLSVLLLKSYRQAGAFQKGILRGQQLFPSTEKMPLPHAYEYSKLLMNAQDWQTATAFWTESEAMPLQDKQLFKASAAIFTDKLKEAEQHLSVLQNSSNPLLIGYQSIIDRGLHGNRKSPFLAGTLSTLLPGAGKAYANQWKDGIISFVFTAGMAFQSYRGFNQKGINSVKGWVYGGLGMGFYLGNIYGSVKAAKNANKKKLNLLQHEASSLFTTYYN